MGILRKISGSTLLESLIASVLIVVIFMVSSLILNNVIETKIKKDTSSIDYFVKKIEYQYLNDNIEIPFSQYENNWYIAVTEERSDNKNFKKIIIKAKHTENQNSLNTYFYVSE